MQTADNCDFFASLNIKKHSNLRLPLNVQKLDVCFSFRGGGIAPLTPQPRPLSFAYCSINTVLLLNTIYDICIYFISHQSSTA